MQRNNSNMNVNVKNRESNLDMNGLRRFLDDNFQNDVHTTLLCSNSKCLQSSTDGKIQWFEQSTLLRAILPIIDPTTLIFPETMIVEAESNAKRELLSRSKLHVFPRGTRIELLHGLEGSGSKDTDMQLLSWYSKLFDVCFIVDGCERIGSDDCDREVILRKTGTKWCLAHRGGSVISVNSTS